MDITSHPSSVNGQLESSERLSPDSLVQAYLVWGLNKVFLLQFHLFQRSFLTLRSAGICTARDEWVNAADQRFPLLSSHCIGNFCNTESLELILVFSAMKRYQGQFVISVLSKNICRNIWLEMVERFFCVQLHNIAFMWEQISI